MALESQPEVDVAPEQANKKIEGQVEDRLNQDKNVVDLNRFKGEEKTVVSSTDEMLANLD